MPAAEGAAGELAGYPDLGVGVHLNACQGPAISPAGRGVLAGEGGRMNAGGPRLIRRCLLRRRRMLAAIEAEFEAQISWCLDRRLKPTHLDTHRHVHAWPAIFRLVGRLCDRYDIPFVRWHRELLPAGCPRPEFKQRCVSGILNRLGRRCRAIAPRRIATAGTLGVAHTGRIDVEFLLAAVACLEGGVSELMVHPGHGEDLPPGETRLRAGRRAEAEALCDPRVRDALAGRNVALVHYGKLI